MPFPNFDPVLIHLGPIAIRWYALAYIAGILLGWRYGVLLVRNAKLWPPATPPVSVPQIDDLILWITLGIILGGRLGYVLFYGRGAFLADPLEIVKVWHGGMSFHGGFLGVVVAVVGFSLVNRIDMLRLGDLVAPCAPIGLFFGRIANFVNGELWGKVTTVPWGMVFPHAGSDPRHPSQLYEAGMEGLLLFIILQISVRVFRWHERPGLVSAIFFTGYGTFRFIAEIFREPDTMFIGWFSLGMAFSIPMWLAAAYFYWYAFRPRAEV